MDNNVFTVKNLSFAYGKQQVLKHLDLELHEGKITTLIGATGCSIVHQYNTAPVDLSVEKLVGYGRTPYHTMGLSPDPREDKEKIHRAMEITHT